MVSGPVRVKRSVTRSASLAGRSRRGEVDRIEVEQRIAGEVHLGDQPLREAAAE